MKYYVLFSAVVKPKQLGFAQDFQNQRWSRSRFYSKIVSRGRRNSEENTVLTLSSSDIHVKGSKNLQDALDQRLAEAK